MDIVLDRSRKLLDSCTGLGFQAAPQATVAQGLLNREAPIVWLSDIAEGLGDAGQQDGAGHRDDDRRLALGLVPCPQ